MVQVKLIKLKAEWVSVCTCVLDTNDFIYLLN